MKTLKLIFGFLLVSLVSAGVAVGIYSYLNKGNTNNSAELFNQGTYHAVGFANAAENTDFTLAAEQSVNGVVHIKSVATPSQRNNSGSGRRYFDPFEFFFGQTPQYQAQPRVGFGSGVIISTDGFIVTNNHVIEGADEIEVTTNDNKTHKAKLIGGDSSTDIALLKIEGADFSVVPFGDSDNLKVGEWVLAVGNPFNLTSTVTAGIVSAKGRGNLGGGRTQDKVQSYIQTDAAVNPGNSGGALVNTKGELVGINTMIYSETGNFVGYSFAVPVNIVKKVITDIKQYGVVQRALLGVTIMELPALKEMEPEKFKALKVEEGVYVNGFATNSPAQKAGIKEGDVIIGVNGHKIHNFSELRAQLSLFNPGNKVDIEVQRGSNKHTYKVELVNDYGTTEMAAPKKLDEVLGATFREVSAEAKSRFGLNYGLEVTNVNNGKLKWGGVQKGYIILTASEAGQSGADVKLRTVDDLGKLVDSIRKNDPDERGLYLKGIDNKGKVFYLGLDLNE